jgi:hypothetical protein
VKDRVEAFGGRVSLHSPRGAGTTLEITLPLSDESAANEASQNSPYVATPGRDPASGPGTADRSSDDVP